MAWEAPYRPRRTPVLRWVAVAVTGLLLLALLVVVAVQANRIEGLRRDTARAQRSAEEASSAADQRLDGVEGRVAALEEHSKAAFDPQAVAASVLPSVFQVIADEFSGSAFVIGDADAGKSNVLTAFHVVEAVWDRGDKTVWLERDGKRHTGVIADVDQDQDVALLVVDAELTGLKAAAEPPESGEDVLVVGSPLGLNETITTGVVSAVREREDGPGSLIQFDASINPGNSGGPVINTHAQVVGIADLKARDAEGIGLAVPIQAACEAFNVC